MNELGHLAATAAASSSSSISIVTCGTGRQEGEQQQQEVESARKAGRAGRLRTDPEVAQVEEGGPLVIRLDRWSSSPLHYGPMNAFRTRRGVTVLILLIDFGDIEKLREYFCNFLTKIMASKKKSSWQTIFFDYFFRLP